MKTVFSFDFISASFTDQQRRHAIFFFDRVELSIHDCYQAIDAHYSRQPISDDVTFICLAGNEGVLRSALADRRVATRIRHTAEGKAAPRPRILFVHFSGKIFELTGDQYEKPIIASRELCNAIQHHGANYIFRKHDGMLEASASHHYVKPSLKHTDRFMRIGTILVNGVEIDFLAVWLLPLLGHGIKHVYTDSSTINSVAYALVLLRNRLASESERIYPTIQSFESYKGLNESTFPDKESSLVLVSASSGGGMMQDIVDKYRIDSNRLCTLYYLGDGLPLGKTLCNLTRTRSNPDGYLPAIITSSGDRGSFPAYSLPVHILAEAFVPENPIVEAVQVTIDDIPKWWHSFKQSFIGRHAIRCYSRDPAEVDMSSPPRHPIVIDMKVILQSDTLFTSKIRQMLKTSVPITLKTVIVFDDAGSKSIANRLLRVVQEQNGQRRHIQQVVAAKYTGQNGEGFEVAEHEQSSCCVVCSVLADGTRLLDITQILRNRQKNHAINFIVGLVVSPSSNDLRELKSNICYSQTKIQHPLHIVESIELPRVFRGEPTPWDEELLFWTEQLNKMKRQVRLSDVRRAIELRIAQLQNPDSGLGFINNAFIDNSLFTHDSPSLKLRPNSVFTEGVQSDLLFSQADVFVAATAVLHNLRTRKVGATRLEQHPYKRTVISPSLFYRFNDGIIQAAFLRAATSSELDYCMDRNMSKLMGDVLIGIFQVPESQRAEALLEMLYAIASGKLRMLRVDLDAFLVRIEPRLIKKPKFKLESFLCQIIRKKHLKVEL